MSTSAQSIAVERNLRPAPGLPHADPTVSFTARESVEHGKIAAARETVEVLRANAESMSNERALPAAMLHRLKADGLLGLLRPESFGGEGVSLKAAIEVCRELALGDASAAWVHGVFTTHDHLVGLFPTEAQQDYWNSADTPLCASSFTPSGKAVPVDGGWELSGTWSFCSGVDHANWTMVGGITGMIPGDRPMPDRQLFLVPASDYAIVDDWHVLGLRGTGSKSILLDRVFVPATRVLRDLDVVHATAPGAQAHGASEYRYPAWPLLNFTLVGLAAKIARNAYEHCVRELPAATGGKPNPLFDIRRPAAAMHLAEASAKIDAAELLFTRALDETFSTVSAEKGLPMALRVRNRRDQCYAARLSLEAVSLLMGVGGARGIREGGVVQRTYRDLSALTLHPGSNWDATALSFGNVAMGGYPTEIIV